MASNEAQMTSHNAYEEITVVPDQKHYISYNHIHKLTQKSAAYLDSHGKNPQVIIAIGGGGFIPARMIRSFLKTAKNIPIKAIGLSLYDENDKIGKQVNRTQWLNPEDLIPFLGKRLLIVDEVDDTRTTLYYAYHELKKQIEELETQNSIKGTKLGIFVIHNKNKPKNVDWEIEDYFVGEVIENVWISYPWDSQDIDLHTRYAKLQGNI